MERFNALGRGTQIMLVGAVLLFIDLFLPWQDFDTGGIAESLGIDASFNAWHGFWGWMLGLLTIVLLAWIVVRLAAVNIPIPVSSAMTAGLLGTLILFFAVIKNLVDDESTIWSYIGVGLAILVAVGAWREVQEAGGVEHLKSQIPTTPTPSAPPSETPAAAPAAEPVPPPPAAAPAPAPEAAAPPEPAPEAGGPEAGLAQPEPTSDEPSTERNT